MLIKIGAGFRTLGMASELIRIINLLVDILGLEACMRLGD